MEYLLIVFDLFLYRYLSYIIIVWIMLKFGKKAGNNTESSTSS